MSLKYLGNPFDMHGGGKDLVFPHHENERAQSECATGRRFVNFWVHNGFVTIEREKMSKSVGNILLIKDFVKEHHPEVLRLFFLSAHYRSPIDYTKKSIESADTALQKLYATLQRVDESVAGRNVEGVLNDELKALETRFFEAMDDDFNTAVALSSLFDLETAMNRMLDEAAQEKVPYVVGARALLLSLSSVLGILNEDVSSYEQNEALRHLKRIGIDEASVEKAIQERADARKQRDYGKADRIRKDLLDKGIMLLDTAKGTRWRVKK